MKALFQTNSPDTNANIGMVTSQNIPKNISQVDEIKQITKKWQGLTRSQCLDFFAQNNSKVTKFAHWIAIPHLNLLLTFKKQVCVEVKIIPEMG